MHVSGDLSQSLGSPVTLDLVGEVPASGACQARGLFRHFCVDALLNNPEQAFTPLPGSKFWHLALLEFCLQRNVDISP